MGKRLYVGNLSYDVDSSALQELFSAHGKVLSVDIDTDRDTGQSRGFGFIEMTSDEEAEIALAAVNGMSVKGREVKVTVATIEKQQIIDKKVSFSRPVKIVRLGQQRRRPKAAISPATPQLEISVSDVIGGDFVQPLLEELPHLGWLSASEGTRPFRFALKLTSPTNDALVDYLENDDVGVNANISSWMFHGVTESRLVFLARFPSGAIRSLPAKFIKEGDSRSLHISHVWSLIDPSLSENPLMTTLTLEANVVGFELPEL